MEDDGAEKYNFVSELDTALQCVICLEVAEEPWQHGKCGRLFCEQCLEKLGRDKPCPNCRMPQPQYFEDNKSENLSLCYSMYIFFFLFR